MLIPKYLHLSDFRRGRSGLDPFDLMPGQVAEALNVDGYDGMWGRKRRGSENVTLAGGTVFTGPVNALARWVPGTDDTAAQLFAIDGAATPVLHQMAGGTAFADVPMSDVITSRPQDANWAALNGKLFISYKSAASRLHVYDPSNPTSFASVLVGPGGGGGGDRGGGGGGGQVLEFQDTPALGALPIVVGTGGPGGVGAANGSDGSAPTTFNGHSVAVGKGGVKTTGAGGNSGSGKTGSAGRGNASPDSVGGGGAGDSANGGVSSLNTAGNGGAGTTSSIPAAPTAFGGGGGGGAISGGGVAGTGSNGGGNGSAAGAGSTATANTGGGGGGGKDASNGGAGADGKVIIRYVTGTMTATGGAITTGGSYTYHTFTASGTFTITAITPNVRRVGLAPGTNAPTAANTGSGAYAATTRTYRVRWLQMNGALIIRRSEYTPTVAFTPSGAGSGVLVTQPTPPGEGETHWEVEVSLDGTIFNVLAGVLGVTLSTQISIGSTTYTDSTATTSYATGAVSDPSGYFQLPHSAKFMVSDGNRLIFAGDWDGLQPGSRIWFTPVLNSANKGDDERWVNTNFQKNYMDIGTKDGGEVTALGQPLNGVIFVFKYRAVWALYPTSDPYGPYIYRKLRDDIGCVDQKSVQLCRDVTGRNALHFWDPLTGPWRVSSQGGFEYLGRDVEDITPTVNLAATNRVVHSVWHSAIHQWWVYLAVNGGNDPSIRLVFDPLLVQRDQEGLLRGGWYKHTGDSVVARCSCMFANTPGASMSSDLRPYAGLTNAVTAKIHKCDSATATDDAGTAYQAYIDTGPIFPPLESGVKMSAGEAFLTAKAGAAVTIQATMEADFGIDSKVSTVLLTPVGSETRVYRKFDATTLSELTSLQVRLGDAAAVSSAWTIDRLSIPLMMEGTP